LYDPVLKRFLDTDPAGQGFTPYAYFGNNPVVYVDPNGEFFFSAFVPILGPYLDAAAWGSVIGGAGYTASVAFSPGGLNNWNIGDFAKSLGRGAISGAVTFGIGEMYGEVGDWGKEIFRAYTHGFAQGMISEAYGDGFMTGFASAGLSSLVGSGFMKYGGEFAQSTEGGYAFSAVSGGVGSALTGGNFWEGAAIGTMNFGLNKLQQRSKEYSKELNIGGAANNVGGALMSMTEMKYKLADKWNYQGSFEPINKKVYDIRYYKSMDKVLKFSNYLKVLGRFSFAGGSLLSGYQAYRGDISYVKAGIDIFSAGAMTFGGPPGLIMGGAYFLIDTTIGWQNFFIMRKIMMQGTILPP